MFTTARTVYLPHAAQIIDIVHYLSWCVIARTRTYKFSTSCLQLVRDGVVNQSQLLIF